MSTNIALIYVTYFLPDIIIYKKVNVKYLIYMCVNKTTNFTYITLLLYYFWRRKFRQDLDIQRK